jgi:hypothetical protein
MIRNPELAVAEARMASRYVRRQIILHSQSTKSRLKFNLDRNSDDFKKRDVDRMVSEPERRRKRRRIRPEITEPPVDRTATD